MMLVCTECTKPAAACDCPASIRKRPLAPVEQITKAREAQLARRRAQWTPPPKDAA